METHKLTILLVSGVEKRKIKMKDFPYIVKELILQGFYPEKRSAEGYECDWEKIIDHDDIYRLWVSISLKNRKIYFYDEYECGGMISNFAINIPEDIDLNDCEFVEWLNEKIEENI